MDVSDEMIRNIFMRNGFTIKEGQPDLKPYVYAAARELLSAYKSKSENIDSLKIALLKESMDELIYFQNEHVLNSFMGLGEPIVRVCRLIAKIECVLDISGN